MFADISIQEGAKLLIHRRDAETPRRTGAFSPALFASSEAVGGSPPTRRDAEKYSGIISALSASSAISKPRGEAATSVRRTAPFLRSFSASLRLGGGIPRVSVVNHAF
jgi:hypothetical protein